MRHFSHIRTILIILLLLLCTNGCEQQNRLPPLNNNATILTFGDSLTYGIGAPANSNYPEILASLVGLKVVNSGISGETTSQGVKRFLSVIEQHNPDMIILLEGGNDILRNHSAATTQKNLAQMIEMAETKGIPVILIGVPEKKLFSKSAPLYANLADQYQLVFDGEIISSLLKQARYKSDPIHFNALGYQKLAQRIAQLLKQNGAIN